MARYTAAIDWALREGEDFAHGRYSRGHTVRFDGGTVLPASASPHVVGKWADAAAVDPDR
jgi:hypothetical protein